MQSRQIRVSGTKLKTENSNIVINSHVIVSGSASDLHDKMVTQTNGLTYLVSQRLSRSLEPRMMSSTSAARPLEHRPILRGMSRDQLCLACFRAPISIGETTKREPGQNHEDRRALLTARFKKGDCEIANVEIINIGQATATNIRISFR